MGYSDSLKSTAIGIGILPGRAALSGLREHLASIAGLWVMEAISSESFKMGFLQTLVSQANWREGRTSWVEGKIWVHFKNQETSRSTVFKSYFGERRVVQGHESNCPTSKLPLPFQSGTFFKGHKDYDELALKKVA